MAGDWVKMRVWLRKDPRVIRMADLLAVDRSFMNWLTDPVQQTCDESAYEHVTRNVIRALCVTSLLEVWGTAREQGDRENDDLVLRHASVSTLDEIADVPGFGQALAGVEWAVEEVDGSLRFPKFFKENESPQDRHKRQAADRQAKYRERASRNSDEEVTQTRNVTVTPREEKRREEEERPRKRGSRLPKPMALTPEWKAEATAIVVERGAVGRVLVEGEWEKFCDHFWAKAGADAVKMDWLGTWRNWVRKACEWSGGAKRASGDGIGTYSAAELAQ